MDNPYINNNNNKLNEALFNTIYEIEAVKKNMKGYNYKYADLSSVLEAVKEPCKNNGIYFVQPHKVDNFQAIETTDKQGHTIKKMSGVVSVITEIYHKDDTEKREYVTSCMVEDATDPQKVGSIITYLRRYALVSIFAMEQDDDGLEAKKREEPKKNDSTYNEQKDVYENPINYGIAPIGSVKGKKWIDCDMETLCQAKIHFANKKDKDSIKYYEVINDVIKIKKLELEKKEVPTVSVTEDEDPFNIGDDRDWEEMVNDSEAEKKTPPTQVKDEFDEEDGFDDSLFK